jgi:RNA polymerase sigma-32 factor
VGKSGLTRYLEEIRRFPMLEPQDEFMLAKRWREHGDRDAAHKLVTSHLRLVAKIAMGYRGYGLPISEVISEGNVGLMQAVKRFEPEKGFRLATYAMWWIKAAIQEYILRSWSLVKMGTTANQKKLFFNLRKAKSMVTLWICRMRYWTVRPLSIIAAACWSEIPCGSATSRSAGMTRTSL